MRAVILQQVLDEVVRTARVKLLDAFVTPMTAASCIN